MSGLLPYVESATRSSIINQIGKGGGMGSLENGFHVAVRLYSDNAQVTSKCAKNKEVRYDRSE